MAALHISVVDNLTFCMQTLQPLVSVQAWGRGNVTEPHNFR